MIDAVGTELHINDIVMFAYGGKQDDNLYQGTIVGFKEDQRWSGVKIHNQKTNRKVDRLASRVISIMPIKQVHPENFI